MWNAGVAQR